ncbi:hypothetical protein MRX96_047601 [Rhipicephalus microplus]
MPASFKGVRRSDAQGAAKASLVIDVPLMGSKSEKGRQGGLRNKEPPCGQTVFYKPTPDRAHSAPLRSSTPAENGAFPESRCVTHPNIARLLENGTPLARRPGFKHREGSR